MLCEAVGEPAIMMFSALREDSPVISDSDEEAEFTGKEICCPWEVEEADQGLNWAMHIFPLRTEYSLACTVHVQAKIILVSLCLSVCVCPVCLSTVFLCDCGKL